MPVNDILLKSLDLFFYSMRSAVMILERQFDPNRTVIGAVDMRKNKRFRKQGL